MQPGEQATDDQDPHQPGEVLGFFSVTGKLGSDSCGADGLGAPASWDFQVKLSREGTTLYWLNGREAIVGDIDKRGAFSFATHIDMPLSAKHGAGKGCTIVRTDSAAGSLASSQASFNGKLSYAYAQTPDSDCSEIIATSQGQGAPAVLPCSMTYALSGDRVSDE